MQIPQKWNRVRLLVTDARLRERTSRMTTRVCDGAGGRCGCGRARRVCGETGPGDVSSAKEEAEYDDEDKESDERRPDIAPLLARNWNFSHEIPHC